ncbi:MAG: type I-E CRISPR-associated protein Cse2/CasB [Flexilinea sp.]
MSSEEKLSPLIKFLIGLTSEKDRGTLAELRRGLQYPPGQAVEMYRYIARYVPNEYRGKQKEKIYYLIAALFAYHPLNTAEGNFGNHMAITANLAGNPVSTERRFTILLNANIEDLPGYMRQAVSLLKSKDIPVNWEELMSDLLRWGLPEKYIQRKWANAFWTYQKPDSEK